MINRELEDNLIKSAKSYPIIALTGPRQSGKTTIIKKIFGNDYKYINLEDLEMRRFANEDPKSFLEQFSEKVIIDEAQNAPDLFSYIQVIVDEKNKPGQFILTGSQNFLLLEKISQSLAGRVSIFHLLPLTISELKNADYKIDNIEQLLFNGFYPRIYNQNLEPQEWLANYIQTYIERDVRSLKNIKDLSSFQRFIRMCAARCGQLVDLTSLGNDCGISHNTVKEWLNILEASFIIFLLKPHYKNYNKRLVKSPKIYFYDTGLLCYLLNIENPDQLKTHYLRGGIFESFVISEIIKKKINKNLQPNVYFWRDQAGHEIDCVLEKSNEIIPIEIKSSKTINDSYFSNLLYWNKISSSDSKNNIIIYAGKETFKRSQGNIFSWEKIDTIQ
ncbi:MAG TPA: ATP-binding protein [Chlamydiales bacterium]|nr:ATP-binding protein [Chlamydiales bacterium]